MLRHGESRSNAELWLSGVATCKGLTERGAGEARRLGVALRADPSLRPDRVVTSSMPRSVETATIATAGVGVTLEPLDQLIERTPGECEGMTVAEYTEHYGHRPWHDWRLPLSPGGESEAEFSARVDAAIGALVDAGRGATTWVFCHGGIIMTAADHLMGISGGLAQPRWAAPANASITEWLRPAAGEPDGRWRLRRYNDHAHLVVGPGQPDRE
jgi:probable phosphoglycerate mutase